MPAGSTIDIPPEHTERAVYVAEGEIELEGGRYASGTLAVLETGADVVVRAVHTARLMLLGGERFPTPRLIWWNFVSSSVERMERAKRDWTEQRFGRVPGETEFIPLPPR
jgi:redox-sensitive bicupin YhaK (pirin superfamily)